MSKWVAKKDDALSGAGQGSSSFHAITKDSAVVLAAAAAAASASGGKTSLEVARRQAGEKRRQIRLAAQEARGEKGASRKASIGSEDGPQVGPTGSLSALVGAVGTPSQSPSVEALLASARDSELNSAAASAGGSNSTGRAGRKAEKEKAKKTPASGNNGGGEYKEWDEWGGWGSSDWKQDWSYSSGQNHDYNWHNHHNEDDWRVAEDWNSWEESPNWMDSEWQDYITIKESMIQVDLARANLGDADLKALTKHLDGLLKQFTDNNGGNYVLNIDLSNNAYITDEGVATHLASFLSKWPDCHRLKLYKNAIGDQALKALSSWVAEGYVHELHLSDLFGKVTADSVNHMLKEIHRKGNYPYVNGGRAKCPLWLRLEHNGIRDVEDVVSKAKAAGNPISVLDRGDMSRVRPGSSNVKSGLKETNAVNLVLFRIQDRKYKSGDRRASAPSPPEEDEVSEKGKGGKGESGKGGKGSSKAKDWQADDDFAGGSKGYGKGKTWEEKEKDKDKDGKSRNSKKENITAADLMMGCATYRSGTTRGAVQTPYPPTGKAKKASIDIGSSMAFPSLGGGTAEKSSDGPGLWGAPNMSAAVAWGSAPTAVFDGKAKAAPPKAAPKPMGLPPPPQKAPAPAGASGFAASAAEALKGSPPAAQEPHAEAAELEEPGEEEDKVEETEHDRMSRPLSFAEKNILKARKKLREVEKIEEARNSGVKLEQTQLEKVRKKALLEQELRALEQRSRAQGGRTLDELEKADQWRKEHDQRGKAAICIQKVVRGHIIRIALERHYEDAAHDAERPAAPDAAPPKSAPAPAPAGGAKAPPPSAAPKNPPAPAPQAAQKMAAAPSSPASAPPSGPPKQPPKQPPAQPPKQPPSTPPAHAKQPPGAPPSQAPAGPPGKSPAQAAQAAQAAAKDDASGGAAPKAAAPKTAPKATAPTAAPPATAPSAAPAASPAQAPTAPPQKMAPAPQAAPKQPPKAPPQHAPQQAPQSGAKAPQSAPQQPPQQSAPKKILQASHAPAAQEDAKEAKKAQLAAQQQQQQQQLEQQQLQQVQEQMEAAQRQQAQQQARQLAAQQQQQQQQAQQQQAAAEQRKQAAQHAAQQQQQQQQQQASMMAGLAHHAAQQAAAQQMAMQQAAAQVQQQLRQQKQQQAEAERRVHAAEQQAEALRQKQLAVQQTLQQQPPEDPIRARVWWYRDPQGQTQGPFSTQEMRNWNSCGYFQADLPIRYGDQGQFLPLGGMFPAPMTPFSTFPGPPPMSQNAQAEAALNRLAQEKANADAAVKVAAQQAAVERERTLALHRAAEERAIVAERAAQEKAMHDQAAAAEKKAKLAQEQAAAAAERARSEQAAAEKAAAVRAAAERAAAEAAARAEEERRAAEEAAAAERAAAEKAAAEKAAADKAAAEKAAAEKAAAQKAAAERAAAEKAAAEKAAAEKAAAEEAAAAAQAAAEQAAAEKAAAEKAAAEKAAAEKAAAATAKAAPQRGAGSAAQPAQPAQPKNPPSGPPGPNLGDGQASAFAKFFKRIGNNVPVPPAEAAAQAAAPAPTAAPAAAPKAAAAAPKAAAPKAAAVPTPAQAQRPASPTTPPVREPPVREPPAGKDKDGKDREAKEAAEIKAAETPKEAWPRRTTSQDSPASAADAARAAPKAKQGLGLPPPGTVSKRDEKKVEEEAPSSAKAATPAAKPSAAAAAPAKEEDEEERVLETHPLDHRFVGLVIGKAGETIKSFKKQSGASIEIDQDLPESIPRRVIYRGTRKQVVAAKKLVDGLVLRAKEDEKQKANEKLVGSGTGMGIMGRGPAGDREAGEPKAASNGGGRGEAVPETKALAEGELPPWRRGKLGEEEPRPTQGSGVDARLRANPARRDAPWASKREKDVEAAPTGSLTGSLSGAVNLSMRPAWMRNRGANEEVEATPMLGPFEKSLWNEQKYARNLFMQAKQKILRGKAYEVPEEMMTMTTGVRPKWKPDKRDKDHPEDGAPQDVATSDAVEGVGAIILGIGDHAGERWGKVIAEADSIWHLESGRHAKKKYEGIHWRWERATSPQPPSTPTPQGAPESPADASKNEATPKKSKTSASGSGGGLYENMPGDSKDIMKLKKKLREIQKIEEAIYAREPVEPNQQEKVTKKAGYLEELRTLEAIAAQAVDQEA